jgi:hypothetical protein
MDSDYEEPGLHQAITGRDIDALVQLKYSGTSTLRQRR